MFGELGDSDIYENNRGGSFDDSSDANFSFDAQDDANASVSDDFLDTFDSDDNFTPEGPSQGPQSGLLGGVPGVGAFEQNAQPQESPEVQQVAQKKSSPILFLILLILLFVAAVGMFFYKKNAEQAPAPDAQAMGDYFYDKASGNTDSATPEATPVAQSTPDANVATVDVDLTQGVSKNTDVKDKVAKADEAKPLTAIEKAIAKQKADEAKESQIGLHTTSSIVIPVSSGGRVDPFLPYGQQMANAVKPKFDLVAPPLEIPVEDPMVDKLLNFKITGIMYDNIRPSAILTVDDTEQLVHKGDVVMGYKILNITKNAVIVKYKTNIYEVSTGQTLNAGVNLNPVSSISQQFGGVYNKSGKNVIQFNK